MKGLITALQNESKNRNAANAELRETIVSARGNEAAARTKLDIVDGERQDLAVRLAKAETEVSSLKQQVRIHLLRNSKPLTFSGLDSYLLYPSGSRCG